MDNLEAAATDFLKAFDELGKILERDNVLIEFNVQMDLQRAKKRLMSLLGIESPEPTK